MWPIVQDSYSRILVVGGSPTCVCLYVSGSDSAPRPGDRAYIPRQNTLGSPLSRVGRDRKQPPQRASTRPSVCVSILSLGGTRRQPVPVSLQGGGVYVLGSAGCFRLVVLLVSALIVSGRARACPHAVQMAANPMCLQRVHSPLWHSSANAVFTAFDKQGLGVICVPRMVRVSISCCSSVCHDDSPHPAVLNEQGVIRLSLPRSLSLSHGASC